MTYEEVLAFLDTHNTSIAIPLEMKATISKALENAIWHRTAVEKPTIEKEYLCCTIDERYRIKSFGVLCWANDLYEVDNFDFADKRLKHGFYYYDSEYGYIDCDCTYWKEIDWSPEIGGNSDGR